MEQAISVTEVGDSWWRVQAVNDHYAIIKNHSVIAVVEKREAGWWYCPIAPFTGEEWFGSSAAACLKYARQFAESA